jgi:hypothetical protein
MPVGMRQNCCRFVQAQRCVQLRVMSTLNCLGSDASTCGATCRVLLQRTLLTVHMGLQGCSAAVMYSAAISGCRCHDTSSAAL